MKNSKVLTEFRLPKEGEFYTSDKIDYVIDNYLINTKRVKTRGKKKNKTYYNVACAFDTETTSTYYDDEKVAWVYCWSMCLNGAPIFGRTIQEFIEVLSTLRDRLELNENLILVMYVHNLAFDFQFFRKYIKWLNVFSLDERQPVKALSEYFIEFRCSYVLTGYSLETIGARHLFKYQVKKKVGDLDYFLIRTCDTPMTQREIDYAIRDVVVVCAFIQEKIEEEKSIVNIPLTKTSYVRREVRRLCYPTTKDKRAEYYEYKTMIHSLTMSVDEYLQLKRAFQGGFTHANVLKVGIVHKNVGSIDFTSSYPSVCCSEKFPMTKGRIVNITNAHDFNYYLKNNCCLFDIEFTNLQSRFLFENIVSFSKCWKIENYVVNNGRVVSASILCTTITEQDFFNIKNFYTFDSFKVNNFRIYGKQYLPKPIIESVINFYEKKTTLKDIEGEELEYLKSKENVNSIYGMMVTDPARDEILYENEWSSKSPKLKEVIEAYNDSTSRFLFYAWGVWVTAYARRNLMRGILEFADDYIYSDTDSIKATNMNNHLDYINNYNEEITNKIKECLTYRDIDPSRACPKTIKGDYKPLGVWSYEGEYQEFKTLGAKRYFTKKNDAYSFTISGLNKRVALPYILSQTDNPMDYFNDEMTIPSSYTGKNTHTYIDYECHGMIKDYLDNYGEFDSLSSCHIEPTSFTLSLASEFIDYLFKVKTKMIT